MNIVYTFDDGFAEITGVSIVSLLENNRNVSDISVFIIDCGISDNGKLKLRKICDDYHRGITFIDALNLEERIGFKPESRIWSTVCYERLFYAELLPHNLDKALHIDCDTIIRNNIEEIYYTNLGEKYCGACYDCTPKPKRQAGLNADTPYISNGLILLNLVKWREDRLGDKFVEYITRNNEKLLHLDQDVLNGVIEKNVVILPAQYNMMPITLMYGKLCTALFMPSHPYYSKEEIDYAVKHPVVIHFTGCRYTRRPWDQPCNHWYNKEWVNYYHMLDYSIDRRCLEQKKRKFLLLKQAINHLFLFGSRIPIINRLLFSYDCKFVYRINK